MELHTKQLGNLGEMAVAADLIRNGYYVFTELGDICKADLIVLDKDYNPIKVQVKTLTLKNGSFALQASKSGPNYRFRYDKRHADVFAVYVHERNTIAYISSKELLQYQTLTIRVDATQNGQSKAVNWISNYSDFKRALRDCTQDTPPLSEGNEPVQTSKP
jgi:hypothetical protein